MNSMKISKVLLSVVSLAAFGVFAPTAEGMSSDGSPTLTKAEEFLDQPYSRELRLDADGEFLATAWARYVTLASPQSNLDDVLRAFVIGLEQPEAYAEAIIEFLEQP
jgi:hypothetical protein